MAREYDIEKLSERCSACGRELAGGEEFVAALFDTEDGFRRDDFCKPCWDGRAGGAAEAFSVWHSQVPQPDEPKKQFVNNEVLVDFFEKLDGQDAPSKVNFRFVLALMLMRKKLLLYDGSARDETDQEVWTMHFRPSAGSGRPEVLEGRSEQTPVKVVRPELNEEQIAEVGAQLGSLFEVQT